MTRKSRREIESALDDLAPTDDADPLAEYDAVIAYRVSEGWINDDGEPLPDDPDAPIRYGGVTIERAKAEREGYEILNEQVEGTHGDCVRVPWDYGDREGPA